MKTRSLKRLAAFLLSFVMVLGMCAFPAPQRAEAAENITFTAVADQKDLSRGDTVNVTVSMSGNSGNIYGMIFRIYYDSEVVEPVIGSNNRPAITQGDAVPGNGALVQMGPTADQLAGRVNMVVVSPSDAFKDGTVLTASFKVKEDARAGEFAFGFRDIEITDLMGNQNTNFTVNDQTAGLNVSVPVTGISLDRTSMTLAKGTTGQLTAAVEPADAAASIQWSSSNAQVASVDENGLVTANAAGEAVITAKAGDKSASCSVRVTNPLTGITIVSEDGRDTLNKGQTLQLSVQYEPADAEGDKTAAWTSSDPSVAEIDGNGLVTALKDGTTTITATVGSLTDTFAITVQEVPLVSISLNKTETLIHRGESEKLTVSYNPENTTDDRRVTWTSSDPSSVTVDADGNVTAAALGGAVITAKVGNHTAQCVVSVDAPLQSIEPEQTEISMIKNQTAEIRYTLNPSDTTSDKTVTMTSSDESVVTVDENGVLTAKSAGSAVITLSGAEGITAQVNVTVTEIPIDSVVLSRQSVTVERGETAELTAAITPADTTDEDTTITWTSSDESVVTVNPAKSESGEAVTIQATDKGGRAVITAETANGKTAQCEVHVPIHMESIELGDPFDMLRGQTTTLEVTYNPENTDDDRDVTWTSSDPSVASVDAETGVIKALKEGTAEITAATTKTAEPFTDSVEVTVKENHLDEEAAEGLTFNGPEDPVLKGQKIYMTDYLTLDQIVEEGKITDDITAEWSVEDETVASIDQSGCLTGLKEGGTTVKVLIRATDGNGEEIGVYELETTVQVKEIPLESIAFDKVITEMKVGEKATLGILYNPENTTDDREVTWTSSDPSVLSVDNGTLTANKAGKAVITAKAGDKSVSCEITVKENQSGNGGQAGSDGQSGDNGSGNAAGKNEGGNVQTGDAAPVGAWAAVLVFAAAAVAAVIALKRKMR